MSVIRVENLNKSIKGKEILEDLLSQWREGIVWP